MVPSLRYLPVFLALLLFSLTSCGPSDPPDVPTFTSTHPGTSTGDLTAYLDAYADTYDIPALAAAVITRDNIVAIGVAGTRINGETIPVTLDDHFHIGSCTKSMTATLAALLVEDSVLTWDTTVGEVFRDTQPTMDSAWNRVALHHLLTNSGGVSDDIEGDFPDVWARFDGDFRGPDVLPIDQRRFMTEQVLAQPPTRSPGTRYLYSNLGFSLAGAMLETVTGIPFEELLVARLFQPLGMTSAGFGAPGRPGQVDQPWGHHADGTPEPPGWLADNAPMLSPAGRVHLNIEDWAKYVQFHLAGGSDGHPLLSAPSFQRLHTPFKGEQEDYAMGWVVTDEAGPDVATLRHTGSNTIWYSMVWIVPDRDIGVIVVGNRGDAREEIDQTLWQLVVDQIERRTG